ncbi:MAG: acetoin utilization protein AcuC [Gammaproteobacteria bacterium]|nr:acetoin utilization protein AcuC [Gammaproteobacteria bacterium]
MKTQTVVYYGEALANYHFGDAHPFGPQRHQAFLTEFKRRGLDQRCEMKTPVVATQTQIELFHTHDYVEQVKAASLTGHGLLDGGDTPARAGIYEAAGTVVGTVIDAIDTLMTTPGFTQPHHAFVPIAGLHHAARDHAAGFCVFNDCGVAIEYLRQAHQVQRIAYIDIDAHHGDGVFYAFEADPDLCFVDLHEDGRFLYPGTGAADETGAGKARGCKLNIPLPMYANDEILQKIWPTVEAFVRKSKPEFILLQCGADSIKGDPLTHMMYTPRSHAFVTQRLCLLANESAKGRLLALGGGGYHLDNIASAWCAVVESMLEYEASIEPKR